MFELRAPAGGAVALCDGETVLGRALLGGDRRCSRAQCVFRVTKTVCAARSAGLNRCKIVRNAAVVAIPKDAFLPLQHGDVVSFLPNGDLPYTLHFTADSTSGGGDGDSDTEVESDSDAATAVKQQSSQQLGAAKRASDSDDSLHLPSASAAGASASSPARSATAVGAPTIVEHQGDLFTSSDALAHCISVDLVMGKGIAKAFRDKFGGRDELAKQALPRGGCGVLRRTGRYVFYLITKDKFFHKPTYDTLRQSLQAMRKLCSENHVTRVSMPKIGCGLDGLSWAEVRRVIDEVFDGSGITITVYTL